MTTSATASGPRKAREPAEAERKQMYADLSELEPVERRSTVAIVADRIRTAIMRGIFPPGTQLGEVELAARLGVSRGPLRARTAVERAAGLLLLAGDRAAAAERLTAALALMEAAADDPVALADADHAFHAELVAASGSPRLRRMADTLLVETRMCLAALQETLPPAAALITEHRELRDAVRDGDAGRMAAVLEAHMADAVERILAPGPSAAPAVPA